MVRRLERKVALSLVPIAVQQKLTFCKAIILQLKLLKIPTLLLMMKLVSEKTVERTELGEKYSFLSGINLA